MSKTSVFLIPCWLLAALPVDHVPVLILPVLNLVKSLLYWLLLQSKRIFCYSSSGAPLYAFGDQAGKWRGKKEEINWRLNNGREKDSELLKLTVSRGNKGMCEFEKRVVQHAWNRKEKTETAFEVVVEGIK